MDAGLLGGIGQGLMAGVQSYNQAKQMSLEERRQQEDQRMRKAMLDADYVSKGLMNDPETGQVKMTPEMAQKHSMELENEQLGLGKARKEAENYDTDKSLSRQKTQAEIEFEKAKAQVFKNKSKGLLNPNKAPKEPPTETKKALGYIATVNSGLDKYLQMTKDGNSIPLIDPDTSIVGGMVSDTPLTILTRQMAENYGRLQSGGAINKEEEARFMKMLPRYNDKPEIRQMKLKTLRDELNIKQNTYLPNQATGTTSLSDEDLDKQLNELMSGG